MQHFTMKKSSLTRREFLKTSTLTAAATYVGALGFSAASYGRIPGANDRVRVGVVGFSDRFRSTLMPCFLDSAKELNFDFVAVSDLWSVRRDEGKMQLEKNTGHKIAAFHNNDELFAMKDLDAVMISTPDFAHALHTVAAVKAGCDTYTEKPLAETMEDARAVLKAVKSSDRIVQIGSQRRSGANYQAAESFIKSGRFGDIVMVEMTWNVNQPGRWRRPELVAKIKEQDLDWQRFLLNRPPEPFNARKYLEYRLFWPFSSGIPGQWMCHQIDTVHWFTGLPHPRSAVANGGIYAWRDGRKNPDTLSTVFDYGPLNNKEKGFQVLYSSRQTNSEGGTKEIYYSNGGTLDLGNNRISSKGGLRKKEAKQMNMEPFLLPDKSLSEVVAKTATAANTGKDNTSVAHVRNWMECVRSRKQPNAPIEAGYNHAIAIIMANAAYRTGERVIFDEATQEVLAGSKPFKF